MSFWIFAMEEKNPVYGQKRVYVVSKEMPKPCIRTEFYLWKFSKWVLESSTGLPYSQRGMGFFLAEEFFDTIFPHLRKPNLNELFEVKADGEVVVWAWTP